MADCAKLGNLKHKSDRLHHYQYHHLHTSDDVSESAPTFIPNHFAKGSYRISYTRWELRRTALAHRVAHLTAHLGRYGYQGSLCDLVDENQLPARLAGTRVHPSLRGL